MKTFKNFNNFLFAILFIIFNASYQVCIAQDAPVLIHESPIGHEELNGTQLEILNTLAENENIVELSLIQIGELNTPSFEYGEIMVILSSLQCDTLIFQVNNIEYESEDNYRLFANLKDTTRDSIMDMCTTGSLTLVSVDGKKYGALGVEDESYIISDLGDGIQIMMKHAVISIDEYKCGDMTSVAEPELHVQNTDPCIGHKLRILVFYTPATANTGLDPVAVAYASLAQFEGTLFNSEIYGYDVEIADVLSYNITEDPINI